MAAMCWLSKCSVIRWILSKLWASLEHGAMTEDKDDIKQVARKFSASAISKGFKPQALHEYQDEKGNALFWCIRLKHPETGEKWIRPLHFNKNLNKYILKKP